MTAHPLRQRVPEAPRDRQVVPLAVVRLRTVHAQHQHRTVQVGPVRRTPVDRQGAARGDVAAACRLLADTGGRLVDGLIISPWSVSPEDLTARARDVPVVLLGERDPHGAADRVAVDNVLAADQATTHLIETGRRRVAAIGLQPHLRNGTADQRLAGYRSALARAGLTPDPAAEREVAALHRRDGAEAMTALLASGARPDAVFAFTDELALGALHVAHEAGLDVPGDLAVVGFDDIEDGRYAHPPLTTVVPDKRQIAERALQCLADRVYSPAPGVPPLDVVVPHRLEIRGSTGRVMP